MSEPKLSMAASARLESRFSRIYSSALVVLHVEVTANVIIESQYLNAANWLVYLAVTIPIAGMSISAWRFGRLGIWAYLHGASVLAAMVQWPFLVLDPLALPDNFQAWIWWLVGTATISVGVANPRWLGWIYLVVASAGWYFLDTSVFGGSGRPDNALQDAVYVFLLGGAVSSLVRLTRQGARRADEANSTAIEKAVQRAQIDAAERERQRIDALVHDRVLNTLLVAAKAVTLAEQKAVAKAASEAIASLEAAAGDQMRQAHVTTLGLYRSLRKAALRAAGGIEVKLSSAGLEEIPAEVAEAITEATLQAIDNSLRHSAATRISLELGSETSTGLLVRICDQGKGFNPGRIPKDRLGVRNSIQARMNIVGGQALVTSEPGKGTVVELRWSK